MNIFLGMAFTRLTASLFKVAIDEVNKSMKSISIPDLCHHYSPIIDEIIFKYIEQGYHSGGGNFIVKKEEEKIKVEIILFFQDDKEQWHKMNLESSLESSFFCESAIQEILTAKSIQFPIEIPSKKAA